MRNTSISCFIFFVSLSITTFSQQKHELETYRLISKDGNAVNIKSLSRKKLKNVKHLQRMLHGGIWDEIVPNLVYVPKATYVVHYEGSDTNNPPQKPEDKKQYMGVNPFYLLNTEVTNKMYRYFLADSTDIKYQPNYNIDTSIANADLLKYFSLVKNGKKYDLSNYGELDDYPVVGVNRYAALAFCRWLSLKASQLINYKVDKPRVGSFYVPSEAQYEIAAMMNTVEEDATQEELFTVITKKAQGKHFEINCGQTIKPDGSIERKFDDDGFYFTNPVKEFPAGRLGLYGMQGNAAEWVSQIFILKRQWNAKDYAATVKRNNGKYVYVVKGGSWYDSPFYLQPCVRQIYEAGETSPRIGFRIAAFDYEELLK
jgi:formylglycine-generating enzyme required for sulfatase activity